MTSMLFLREKKLAVGECWICGQQGFSLRSVTAGRACFLLRWTRCIYIFNKTNHKTKHKTNHMQNQSHHQLLRMNCRAAMEIKTTMMKKVRSMSSTYPITPITLSGIRSKGMRMQTITKKNMRSRCTLRMKYTKNCGLNTNLRILYKTQGSSTNLRSKGRLSSKRVLQSLSFCSISYVSGVCQKSLKSTFISWRQSGHFIFQCCRSYREKMHSEQKEWPQVEETGLSLGYPRQMEQTSSLACLSLLCLSSSFYSMRTSSDICMRTYSLRQVQLQAMSVATAMKGNERAIITYEPTAYITL